MELPRIRGILASGTGETDWVGLTDPDVSVVAGWVGLTGPWFLLLGNKEERRKVNGIVVQKCENDRERVGVREREGERKI